MSFTEGMQQLMAARTLRLTTNPVSIPIRRHNLHLWVQEAHLLSQLFYFQIGKPLIQKQHLWLFGLHQGHRLRASACLPHPPAKSGKSG